MEMLDKFLYSFFGKLDDAIAFVETYVIKITEWCWQSRVKLLNKRRKRKQSHPYDHNDAYHNNPNDSEPDAYKRNIPDYSSNDRANNDPTHHQNLDL